MRSATFNSANADARAFHVRSFMLVCLVVTEMSRHCSNAPWPLRTLECRKHKYTITVPESTPDRHTKFPALSTTLSSSRRIAVREECAAHDLRCLTPRGVVAPAEVEVTTYLNTACAGVDGT